MHIDDIKILYNNIPNLLSLLRLMQINRYADTKASHAQNSNMKLDSYRYGNE